MLCMRLIVLLIAISSILNGQTYEMDAINGQTISTCGGLFFDSGGAVGDYTSGENLTVTFCASSTGAGLRLTFTDYEVTAGGAFCFYDGPNIAAPLIVCGNNLLPPVNISTSATNTSGCLTIIFNSTDVAEGWEANIICVLPCQTIEPTIVGAAVGGNILTIPLPAYLDICQGETVQLIGSANYPQSGQFYNQSDATSQFEWNFGSGDGTTQGPFGLNVFNRPGGYRARLFVTDSNGCRQFIEQKIRVSSSPAYNIAYPDTACQADTFSISFQPRGELLHFGEPYQMSDTAYLPAGPQTTVNSVIQVGGFSNNATLTTLNDLLAICLNMEYSFLGDIRLSVTCPSGRRVVLKEFVPNNLTNTLQTNLGEPVSDFASSGVAGVGYDYCFVENANFGTMNIEAAPGIYTYTYTNTQGVVESDSYLPAGTYSTETPLSNLVGCPLNGNWTLTYDNFQLQDDGFLFDWRILFGPNLYPAPDTFRPGIVQSRWISAPGMVHTSADSISISLPQPGTYTYRCETTDDFGCTYDTSFHIVVLPTNDLRCLSCDSISVQVTASADTICPGETVQLTGSIASSQFRCGSYVVSRITPDFINTLGTRLAMADETLSPSLPIGFDFDFFCQRKTEFSVHSNGFITFDPASAILNPFSNGPIPSTGDANDLIALFWTNLIPDFFSNITYQTFGAAPNRRLVVQFIAVNTASSLLNRGQLVLFEGSNIIEFHLEFASNSGNVSVGIENADGTVGFTPPNMNNRPLTINREAWRFTPALTYIQSNTNFGWSPSTIVTPTNSLTPTSSPTASTNYRLRAQVLECVFTAYDFVEVTPLPINPTFDNGTNQAIITEGNSIGMSSGANQAGVSYQWSPTHILTSASGVTNTSIPSLSSGNYPIIVTAENGTCTSVGNLYLQVVPVDLPPFLPNAFTPNGDQVNDSVFPKLPNGATLLEFKVYNRWGRLVHDSLTTPWNGYEGSERQPKDVYMAYISYRLNGEDKMMVGDIALIW